jgi:hypothetical protein
MARRRQGQTPGWASDPRSAGQAAGSGQRPGTGQPGAGEAGTRRGGAHALPRPAARFHGLAVRRLGSRYLPVSCHASADGRTDLARHGHVRSRPTPPGAVRSRPRRPSSSSALEACLQLQRLVPAWSFTPRVGNDGDLTAEGPREPLKAGKELRGSRRRAEAHTTGSVREGGGGFSARFSPAGRGSRWRRGSIELVFMSRLTSQDP